MQNKGKADIDQAIADQDYEEFAKEHPSNGDIEQFEQTLSNMATGQITEEKD